MSRRFRSRKDLQRRKSARCDQALHRPKCACSPRMRRSRGHRLRGTPASRDCLRLERRAAPRAGGVNVIGAPWSSRDAEAASRILTSSSPCLSSGQRLHALLMQSMKCWPSTLERLLLFHVRDIAVPVVIRVLKLGEGVVVRRPLHPDIVDANLLSVCRSSQTIIRRVPDDGHLADFSRSRASCSECVANRLCRK